MSDALDRRGHSRMRCAEDASAPGARPYDAPVAAPRHTCLRFLQGRGAREAGERPFDHRRWVPQQDGGNSMLARHDSGTNVDPRLPRGLRVGGPDARAEPLGRPLPSRPRLGGSLDTACGRLALPRRTPCACRDTKALAPRVAVSSAMLNGETPSRKHSAPPSTSASFAIGASAVELVVAPAQTSPPLPFG